MCCRSVSERGLSPMGEPGRTIAFVFARGGSKGVPRKNLRTVGGVPLVVRAIEVGQQTTSIDTVVVSTDDPEIASVAEAAGAEVPWLRSPELASDSAPEFLSWKHAVDWYSTQVPSSERVGTFVSLPPTAPLRTASDVEVTISRFHAEECDAVVTGTPARRHPSFNMVQLSDDGSIRLATPPDDSVSRRQDAPVLYDLTTVAYVADAAFVSRADRLLDGRVILQTVPERAAWDVDTEFDLLVADLLASGSPQR